MLNMMIQGFKLGYTETTHVLKAFLLYLLVNVIVHVMRITYVESMF